MGEYAIRAKDGQSVKLGTCEQMYYCRWQQRYDVMKFPGSKDGLFWRLPFPDEDGIAVGDFEDYDGWKRNRYSRIDDSFRERMKGEEGVLSDPGLIQMKRDDCGLLLNVPCYHGVKLPDNIGECKAFWNGYSFPIRLCAVKNYPTEMRIVISCICCGHMWSFPFDEIQQYISSIEMRMRLLKTCQAYWIDRHPDDEPSGYEVADRLHGSKGRVIELKCDAKIDQWLLLIDGRVIAAGLHRDLSQKYIEILNEDKKETGRYE